MRYRDRSARRGSMPHARISRSVSIAALVGCACTTGIDVDLSLVDGPRVLAIAATPAEAKPGDAVELTALWVDAAGPRDGDELVWSLCTKRRALAEPGPVATDCLDGDGTVSLGMAASVAARLPDDACRL